jgi:hypothetical protein
VHSPSPGPEHAATACLLNCTNPQLPLIMSFPLDSFPRIHVGADYQVAFRAFSESYLGRISRPTFRHIQRFGCGENRETKTATECR